MPYDLAAHAPQAAHATTVPAPQPGAQPGDMPTPDGRVVVAPQPPAAPMRDPVGDYATAVDLIKVAQRAAAATPLGDVHAGGGAVQPITIDQAHAAAMRAARGDTGGSL